MEWSPKEVWTRLTSDRAREDRLRELSIYGTASSLAAGTRGVEGCIPGTLCQWMPTVKDADEDGPNPEQVLQKLIVQWCETGTSESTSENQNVLAEHLNQKE